MASDDLSTKLAEIQQKIEGIQARYTRESTNEAERLWDALEEIKSSIYEISAAKEEQRQSQVQDPEQISPKLHEEIKDRTQSEEDLREYEEHAGLKLESILSPAREMANLELADLIDAQSIQSLMDDFYELSHIPMSIDDLEGKYSCGRWVAGYLHEVPQGSSCCLQALQGKRYTTLCRHCTWRV